MRGLVPSSKKLWGSCLFLLHVKTCQEGITDAAQNRHQTLNELVPSALDFPASRTVSSGLLVDDINHPKHFVIAACIAQLEILFILTASILSLERKQVGRPEA